MADINIFALGGQDENGKNSIVIEVNNDIYVINTGNKIPVNNRWGVDGIICDNTYLVENKDRIKGVFITHAHDETFGGLPWFLMDVKGVTVYGSKFTTLAIKDRIKKYKIGHNTFKIEVLDKKTKIGNIEVEPFEVANSIAGSRAFNFKTPDGDILVLSNYTNTDLGPYGKTNIDAMVAKTENLLALLVDSRRSNFHGKSHERIDCKHLAEDKIAATSDKQRIIVAAYDEEMYTIQQMLDLAAKYKRPVALYGRTFSLFISELKKQYPNMVLPKIISHQDIARYDNTMVIVSGSWSRLAQRLSRIAAGRDVFLKLKHDDVIISVAPPVNGLEVVYSVSLDDVAKTAPDLLDISDKDFYPTRPTHDDIEVLVNKLKPKYFLPTSALYRYMYVATNAAVKAGVTRDRNVILQNGKILYLKDGKLASQNGRIKQYGDVIIDGFGVGDISHAVIRERQTLGAGGLISISMMIGRRNKKPVGDINVQFVGIATKPELKEIYEKVNGVVMQKFDEMKKFDRNELQNVIRKRVRKVASKLIKKEPFVVITFFEV